MPSASAPEVIPECYTWLRMIKDVATGCGYDLSNLSLSYRTLSKEIHGAPWFGPSVQAHLYALPDDQTRCFIQKAANWHGLEVDPCAPSSISTVTGDGTGGADTDTGTGTGTGR